MAANRRSALPMQAVPVFLVSARLDTATGVISPL